MGQRRKRDGTTRNIPTHTAREALADELLAIRCHRGEPDAFDAAKRVIVDMTTPLLDEISRAYALASFSPTIPAMISPTLMRRAAFAGSLKSTMPSATVPIAPTPTHTA